MPNRTDDDTTTTVRCFLVDDADRVRRWPMRQYSAFQATNRVRKGKDGRWRPVLVDPIPAFVGLTKIRYILLGLSLRNRRPVDCFLAEYNIQYLDGRGRPDLTMQADSIRRAMAMVNESHTTMQAASALPPALAPSRARFGERRVAHQRAQRDKIHRWTPSESVIAQVRALVYGQPPPED
jgi:hypothetical protein